MQTQLMSKMIFLLSSLRCLVHARVVQKRFTCVQLLTCVFYRGGLNYRKWNVLLFVSLLSAWISSLPPFNAKRKVNSGHIMKLHLPCLFGLIMPHFRLLTCFASSPGERDPITMQTGEKIPGLNVRGCDQIVFNKNQRFRLLFKGVFFKGPFIIFIFLDIYFIFHPVLQ